MLSVKHPLADWLSCYFCMICCWVCYERTRSPVLDLFIYKIYCYYCCGSCYYSWVGCVVMIRSCLVGSLLPLPCLVCWTCLFEIWTGLKRSVNNLFAPNAVDFWFCCIAEALIACAIGYSCCSCSCWVIVCCCYYSKTFFLFETTNEETGWPLVVGIVEPFWLSVAVIVPAVVEL